MDAFSMLDLLITLCHVSNTSCHLFHNLDHEYSITRFKVDKDHELSHALVMIFLYVPNDLDWYIGL